MTARLGAATSVKRAQPAASQTMRGPQRERHDPDYLLLFSIVALAALGILMVYSSTGVNSLLSRRPIRRCWLAGAVGRARRGRDACPDAHRLPLPAPDLRTSVPHRRGAARAGPPAIDRTDRAAGDQRFGPLAEDRPAAAHAPGRVRQAGARRLSRPLACPARPAGALVHQRHAAVPVHRRSGAGTGHARARPGHDGRAGNDCGDDVLRRRRQPAPDGGARAGRHRGPGLRGQHGVVPAATRADVPEPVGGGHH